MYPVKVHTKDSRIEERRLRRHDDHQRLLKQRALEAKLSTAREERRQAELAAERRRRAVERALARVRAEVRRAEAEAERRRRAIGNGPGRRCTNRRARPSTRRSRSVKRWKRPPCEGAGSTDRQKALHKRAQRTPSRSALAGAGAGRTARSGIQLARVKKLAEQADLDQRPRDGLSGRSQPRTGEAKRGEMNDATDAPWSRSDDARSDPGRTFEQQRSREQAWEERQERLRRQACARRREEQIVADRLDRREQAGRPI